LGRQNRTARKGLTGKVPEQDCPDRAARTCRKGQAEQDCHDWTARTVQPQKGCQHKTVRRRQLEQNRKKRTTRKGQPCRTARKVQPEWESQNKTGRAAQAEQHRQNQTVRSVLSGQDCRARVFGTEMPAQG
jgi:hypothetical protein